MRKPLDSSQVKSLLSGVIFSLIFLYSGNIKATHAMGMDLSYVQVPGTNQFEFTFTFYRDCAGVSAPPSFTLNVNSTNCAFNSNIVLNQVGFFEDVSQLCPTQITNNTCINPSFPNPGVQPVPRTDFRSHRF